MGVESIYLFTHVPEWINGYFLHSDILWFLPNSLRYFLISSEDHWISKTTVISFVNFRGIEYCSFTAQFLWFHVPFLECYILKT